MIHELTLELASALKAKKCPIPVIEGPEATDTTSFARERIVVEHDGSDNFGPKRGGNHRNPAHRMTRTIGCKTTIYAQSPAASAMEFEHRRRAEHILDLVLVGLESCAYARHNAISFTGGQFIILDALKDSASPAGSVYELKFTVERAVFEQTWAGDKRPEGTLSAFRRTTKASLWGGPNDDDTTTVPADAETSCGE